MEENTGKRQKNKKIISIVNMRNYSIIIIKVILIIDIFNQIMAYNINNFFYSRFSYITLKINGLGNNYILGIQFNKTLYPNEVYINGNKTEEINNGYYFNQIDNYVELRWNNLINDCSNMFRECSKITELNLSNFDISLVTNMNNMFYGCTSLINLDLTNFNTSHVIDMKYMFRNCLSLCSLNVSSFDTSNVITMRGIFYICSSLKSIELSNFNTSKSKDLAGMFYMCSKLENLNLSHFDTSQVTDMIDMFYNCNSLKSLDLSNFVTSNVTNMCQMFYNCHSLISLNISNFDTSQVFNMGKMFYNCSSLISIELSNFNTSKTNNTVEMFAFCTKLESLDLSYFNTPSITNLFHMFYNCSSLKNLNLSNFSTFSVKNMNSAFAYCKSLTSLDLSNFDTSKVTNMGFMFTNCSSLTSLDLSHFDTANVNYMKGMFQNCFSLSSLNLSNFDTSEVTDMRSIFYGCSSLISIDISSFNISKTKDIAGMFYNCSSLKSLDLSHFDTSSVIYLTHMFRFCSSLISLNLSSFNTLNVKYLIAMFENCLSLTYLDLSNFNTSNVTNMEYMFSNCINLEYINLKNFNGNKIINMNNMFFNVSENIVVCLNISEKIASTIKSQCPNYLYIESENNFYCSKESACPKEYQKLIIYKKECIDYYLQNIIIEKEKNMKNEIVKQNKEEEKIYYVEVLEIMEDFFKSENYNTSKIERGHEEIIETKKMTITFTSIENEKNKINSDNINSTTIDFGECENLLRKDYNITSNETLYLKKINLIQKGMKTSKVGYDVYCKLFGENLIKLNLSSCEKSKISIFIPIEITESIDKFNSSSGFYNDICYTTTSEDGTDIILKDRKKDFFDKNLSVCQEECQFSKYDKINNKAECICNIKESTTFIDDLTFNKENLLKNFKDIKNILNFNFLVCYKNLFNKNGIINNIGCYIMLFIILINIISIFIVYKNQFPLIKKKIKEIIYNTNEYKIINKKVKKYKPKNKQKSNVNEISIIKKNKKRRKNNIYNKDKKSSASEKGAKSVIIKHDNNNNNFNNIKNESMYIDEEINELSYDLAIQYDKRTFCQYYISLLKTKHNLICALINNNDYNSTIIKIDLFLIGFSIEYVINALFYNDETMHKIYESKGVFDLESQLPIIIYSTLISYILNTPLNFLALSNDAVISFKQNKDKNNIMTRAKNLENKLTIKFILYFIITLLLLLFFCYYISMFCVIYKNTQFHLLKDTLMSFGLSIIFPFGTFIIFGSLRVYSLSGGKKTRKCIYNLSNFLQSF